MTASTTDAAPPDRSRRWPGLLLALAAVLAIYSAVALHGTSQEAANQRVLPALSPLFEGIRDQGAWLASRLIEHGFGLGGAITATVWLIALLGLVRGGRRAAPLLLLALAVSAATWGQVLLFQAQVTAGIVCYVAGFVAAVGLGIWCPLRALPGFPPVAAAEPTPPGYAPWRPAWWVECLLIVALATACILSRAWALTELSSFLDLENLSVMVQSRTLVGYLGYLSFGFVENNGGAAHPPLQEILFRVFGTSIYMLRMAAVLWSTAGTLLMYWFARRLGGVLTGVIAALFFIAAPEQLFWGRSENTHFAPTAVLVLAMLHLTLWMLRRFSVWSVLAVALLTPFTRYFYSAGIVLVAYPISIVLHALIFVRGAWRKAWYVLPLILLGIGIWTVSLSVMKKGLHPERDWFFVHPAKLYGGTVWTKQGEFANASPAELVRLQAVSMTENLAYVVKALTFNADRGFSHWYLRAQAGPNRTTQNAGLVVLVVLGVGYLIGQIWDRRAFMLLALIGLAVLPGILSADPAARRIAAIYPGFNIIAALFVAAAVRLAWQRAGAAAAWITGDVAALALGAMLLTSMATHYSLDIAPVLFGDHVRFAKPLFEDSDAIIHNLDPPALALVLVFGSLDRFLADPPGYQYVPPGRWLRAVLDPRVDFNDLAYQYSFWPQEIAALRETFEPERITYLLMDTPATHADVELTRALFPDAQVRQYHSPRDNRLLIAFSVDVQAVAALRRPALWTSGGTPAPLLAGVDPTMASGVPPAPIPEGGALMGGGILIDQAGWYAWRLDPPCPGATLLLDGERLPFDEGRPLLAGVHPFALGVPGGCPLPLRLQRQSLTDGRSEVLRAEDLVSPAVAALPGARAATVRSYDGYGPARPIAQVPGQPAGFGHDAAGEISLLVREHGTWRLRRFDADGRQVFEKVVDFPIDRGIASVAVDDAGTIYAQTERFIAIYDRSGTRIGTIGHEAIVWESEVALWEDDRLLVNFPHRSTLAVFNRNGELLEEVAHYTGADGQPNKFYFPATVTVGPDGLVVVRQGDGTALLLRSGPGAFAPQLIASFASPSVAHGAGFDGADRLIVPDETGLRTFDLSGTRLMADDPARDLANKQIPSPAKILATPERLLALDIHQNRVFAIER